MIFNNKLKLIILCFFGFNVPHILAQSNSEPTNEKRLMASMTQITSALSIQRGINSDVACAAKKYDPISIDEYVNFIASMDEKKDKRIRSKSEKDEMRKMLLGLVDMNIPGKGVMWQATYDLMLKNTKNFSNISGEALCDSLNSSAIGLYQKSMDNLKLIKQ